MCNEVPTTTARMEALFKRFYKPLYLYALTFLCDEEQAKDITGGVFQTVWEMLREGSLTPDDRQAVGFLYTTVRHRCLDKLRHDKAIDRYTRLQVGTTPLGTEEEVMEFEQRIQQVKEAIEQLPEPEKSILKCTYFRKMTYRETAEVLHTSVNMIHKRMSIVFKMMRKMLKEEYT
ncbi:RNA polymerase sigma factor [Hallella absiana]|uniref:RNA polymerase sigma factor n=1 Tax=Hallella absiana TaxID=2925336 RepID=UPI0021C6EBDA|nr:sigma-70 family RNA polymerase sigma factor [Hallella absiana]